MEKFWHIYWSIPGKVESEWEWINFLGQLVSILSIKSKGNSINLISNTEFLNKLQWWGLDSLYDTKEIYDEIPIGDKVNQFWSFPKIWGIKKISEKENDFTIIDTDFWIYNPIEISGSGITAYHHEASLLPTYPNPIDFTNLDFKWESNPINCAFIKFKGCDNLIKEWYSIVLDIISNGLDIDQTSSAVFIEQRLLSELASVNDIEVKTLIENIYQPGFYDLWKPEIGYNEENGLKCSNFKHIWGLKSNYDSEDIRELVVGVILESLDWFGYKPSGKLLEKLIENRFTY